MRGQMAAQILSMSAELDRLRPQIAILRAEVERLTGELDAAKHRAAISETNEKECLREVARLKAGLTWIAHTFTEDSHGNMKTLPASAYQKHACDVLRGTEGERG